MKRLRIVVPLALVLALAVVGLVSAQAYTTGFITSVTYQNVGNGDATVVFSFHNETDGSSIDVSRNLPQGAGSSLYVGGLSGSEALPSNFMGSAVVSSDQPIVATLVQIPQSSTVKNRPLSNGFDGGSSEVLVATVLKNKFSTTSKFSVQNADDVAVDVTVDFYDADNPSATPAATVTQNNIPVGAAKYFDAGSISGLGSQFNGSARVTAVENGTSTPANIVASAMELSTTGTAARAFEGVSGGASTVYMPTALCNAFGATSFYAVQNTEPSGGADADVTVNYSNGNSDSATIAPGTKQSFNACNVNSAGFSGAATITSSGGNIVVIGKVGGGGRSTAFLGEPSGADTLALPYVRWTKDSNYNAGTRQRAFIAIQNIGGALNAGDVTVEYLNKNGEVVGTDSLPAIAGGEKANSKAIDASTTSGHTSSELEEFGTPDANPGGGYGGSVIIRGPGGSQLVATVRVSSKVGTSIVAEDYNGIPIQ